MQSHYCISIHKMCVYLGKNTTPTLETKYIETLVSNLSQDTPPIVHLASKTGGDKKGRGTFQNQCRV